MLTRASTAWSNLETVTKAFLVILTIAIVMAVVRVYVLEARGSRETFFLIEQVLWFINLLFVGPFMAVSETNRFFKYLGIALLVVAAIYTLLHNPG